MPGLRNAPLLGASTESEECFLPTVRDFCTLLVGSLPPVVLYETTVQ